MELTVSIIVPCYNHYDFLNEAVKSVIDQSYEPIELIIVDDCSTELNLREQVQVELYYKDLGIKWIRHEKNLGLSAARNTGIAAATGELILPLDADDKIHPNYIIKAVKEYKYRSKDIVSCFLETFGRYTRVSMPPPSPTWSDFRITNRINCCSLFSKAMWLQLGGYDEKMRDGYEDYEFWCRATKAGYKVHTIPEILFYYRKHDTPSMLNGAKLKRNEIMNYMRQKGSI